LPQAPATTAPATATATTRALSFLACLTVGEAYDPAEGEVSMSTEYVFDYEWQQGQRRIQLLEQYADPYTFRHLDELGVEPGWSCLEVGGGGGSVARRLSELVGPQGRVVAVDLDTRFLKEIEAPNVEVRCQDITAGGLPEGEFDLVHTRAVLMHLPERDRVLGDLVRSLRPGGRVLFEEMDGGPLEIFASEIYLEAWRVAIAAQERAGISYSWARRLPSLLAGAGLADVGAECLCVLYESGNGLNELIHLSWKQVLDRVPMPDEDRQVLERAIPLLEEPGQWLGGLGLVTAWGRREL
jgi:SAM-dependent methyltransferase